MAQHDQLPPQAAYTFIVQETIEGVTAPLSIEAPSITERRTAVRLLQANQLLAAQLPAPIVWNTTPEGLPICPSTVRP